MDAVAHYNAHRWDALGSVKGLLTRPDLGITLDAARRRFEVEGRLGPVAGRNVLCLACGGGHQACAFAMLGARVTLVDLSASQIQSDKVAAVHYGVHIETFQADMRDLSLLGGARFDIVYQPYSINFVPDCTEVFDEIRRVTAPGGIYQLTVANPFTLGTSSKDWDGTGYPLNRPYEQGTRLVLGMRIFSIAGPRATAGRFLPPSSTAIRSAQS